MTYKRNLCLVFLSLESFIGPDCTVSTTSHTNPFLLSPLPFSSPSSNVPSLGKSLLATDITGLGKEKGGGGGRGTEVREGHFLTSFLTPFAAIYPKSDPISWAKMGFGLPHPHFLFSGRAGHESGSQRLSDSGGNGDVLTSVWIPCTLPVHVWNVPTVLHYTQYIK